MRHVALRGRWEATFPLAPLIDVIFLLIIFFLCVNQYQKAESEDPTQLPTAATGQRRGDATGLRVILGVDSAGTIRVGGQPVNSADLPNWLAERQLLAGDSPLEVWIRADKQVPYERIEPILRACAQVGIRDVSFKVIYPRDRRVAKGDDG